MDLGTTIPSRKGLSLIRLSRGPITLLFEGTSFFSRDKRKLKKKDSEEKEMFHLVQEDDLQGINSNIIRGWDYRDLE